MSPICVVYSIPAAPELGEVSVSFFYKTKQNTLCDFTTFSLLFETNNLLFLNVLNKEYTRWPRRNAITLIVNFKNIVDETELFFFFFFCRTFIFQQNDTMIINLG